MKLSFLGAAHEVTGSCHCLEVDGKVILIDCGMKQGDEESSNEQFLVSPAKVDFVLLTHAHIDHSGRLPLLYKYGFKGKIFATGATCDLCQVMLRDAAHIQEFEAEWQNRKGRRAGKEAVEPVYSMADAEGVLSLFVSCDYSTQIEVCTGVTVRFVDVGHLLGSASLEVVASENGETKTIVFSGDIGNTDQPIIKDPIYIKKADYVVMESTYGDRNHEPVKTDYVSELAKITDATFARGGNVVIPSFAVGRTQELLYFFRKIKADKLIKSCPDFTVYVDSPLAVEAIEVFHNNIAGYFDKEAMELVNKGINPLSFKGLQTSVTTDESKQINADTHCKVIISASGMCDAGRIKHHLKHNLWKPESTILFVGYQGVGTLGRLLQDGAKSVKLFGETIDVRAEVVTLRGMSGHADQAGLLRWIDEYSPKPQKVFVVHGNGDVTESFAELLRKDKQIDAVAPNLQASFDLSSNEWISNGERQTKNEKLVRSSNSDVFERLMQSVRKLTMLAETYAQKRGEDIAEFTNQINDLCNKWDGK